MVPHSPILGLDIGGTQTTVVLGEYRGRIHDRTSFQTEAKRGFNAVLKPAREVLAEEALPGALDVCRITPSKLGEELGGVAALCAAIAARGGPEPH